MKANNSLKTLIAGLAAILVLAQSSSLMAQEFQFKFNFRGETWPHSISAENWSAAIEQASQDCLNHFSGSQGSEKIKVDEESAQTLLNTCINPR